MRKNVKKIFTWSLIVTFVLVLVIGGTNTAHIWQQIFGPIATFFKTLVGHHGVGLHFSHH